MMPRLFLQQRARRCLLTAATVILLSPVPGNILIDRCPLRARFPHAGQTIQRWRAHARAPQILLFGSSRTGFSLSVETIAPRVRQLSGDDSVQIFNAAIPVGEPMSMNFLCTHLLAEGPAPKLAVVEITPDSVARRNTFLDTVIMRQFTFSDVVENIGDIFHSTSKARSRLLSSRLIPFYRHRFDLQAWAAAVWAGPIVESAPEGPQDVYNNGVWGQGPIHMTGPQETLALRVEEDVRRIHKQLADYEIAGRTPAALEDVVRRCHQRGIKVILLETPMHSALRAIFGPAVTQPYQAFVAHLKHTYDCRFVDFSDRLNDTMFIDALHANEVGRQDCSSRFAEEILGPAWRAEMQGRPD